MLSFLTVNIGAASRERAEALLAWLAKRSEDVFLLTETSAGTGTDYLLGQFPAAASLTTAELRQSRQNSLPSGSVITMKPALIGGAGS